MKGLDKDEFRERFPHLFKEIKNNTATLDVDGVRTDSDEAEKSSGSEESREPNVIEYLRLCDEKDEALEIIDYMEREGKIVQDYADKLRSQLEERGLRSFGSKRKPGSYPFED